VRGVELYAAVDVHYPDAGGALAALVATADRRFADITVERTVFLDQVAAYQPGAFFTRELPALKAVMAGQGPFALLIVDGYVHLDPAGKNGLGAHAHEEFGIPVIGVAKTFFHSATHAVEVRRGEAVKPLYVTSVGIPAGEAADLVRAMAGPFRMPDALRRVDALTRGR